MEKSSPDTVKTKVLRVPLLFSNKHIYRLSDFSYGEWLIFEKGVPKFYLNAFDEPYKELIEKLTIDLEKFLNRKFKEKGLRLDLRGHRFGIPVESKSQIVEFELEKLPLNFLQD